MAQRFSSGECSSMLTRKSPAGRSAQSPDAHYLSSVKLNGSSRVHLLCCVRCGLKLQLQIDGQRAILNRGKDGLHPLTPLFTHYRSVPRSSGKMFPEDKRSRDRRIVSGSLVVCTAVTTEF